MGEKRGLYMCLVGGNLREGEHLGDTGVEGGIILRRIFRKLDVGA
jgi:hypothetical protein